MATIKDVAKAAGVGVGTVSRALSGNGYVDEEKKEYIKKIAREMSYDPTALLKKRNGNNRSNMVGVLLPDSSQPFFGSFLWHVEKALLVKGYRTVIINTGGTAKKVSEAINMVEQHVLDGLIVNSDVTIREIQSLREIPSVSFECEMGKGIPLVASDHVKGGQTAAKILFQCGCKNVAILSVKACTPVYARHRISECKRLLERKNVRVTLVESDGETATFELVENMINEFMNVHDDIDGVFTEDIEAYFCLVQAKKRGLHVPRDFKIVGYDGNTISRFISPQVTTIVQNTRKLAETCVNVLDMRIEGKKVEELYLIPVTLRRGGTTS